MTDAHESTTARAVDVPISLKRLTKKESGIWKIITMDGTSYETQRNHSINSELTVGHYRLRRRATLTVIGSRLVIGIKWES